ncbi:hypothetical protein ACNQ0T_24545, partial [Enterobacter cloacae complex sp.6700776]
YKRQVQLRLNWKDKLGGSGLVHPVTTVHKLAGLMNLRKTTLPGGFFVYGQRLLFAGLIRQHNKLYLKDQNVFTLFPLESNIITCIM